MALSGPESRFAQNYPSDWRERRKRVFERDGYRCGNCGAEGGPDGHATLHCHHIVPISAGGSHHETNLTTVCEVFHGVRTTSHIPATYRVEYEFSGDYLPATTDDSGDGGEDDVDGESDRAGRRKQGRDRGQWRQ